MQSRRNSIISCSIAIAFLASSLVPFLVSDSPNATEPSQKAHILIYDCPTWSGGGGDNLASNASNWEDGALPDTGLTVCFGSPGSASSKACTWDIAKTFARFYINATYTGKITQAANFGTTGDFSAVSGSFDGSTSYTLTVGGNFYQTSGCTFNSNTKLIMTGASKTLTTKDAQGFDRVEIQGTTNIKSNLNTGAGTDAGFIVSGTATIDTGKTIGATGYFFGSYSNTGTIIGGTISTTFYNEDRTWTFGTASTTNFIFKTTNDCSANRTLTMTANSVIGGLYLYSQHATNTMVLSHASNYQLTVNGAVILGTRARLTQGTGAWSFGSYTQSGASSNFTQGGNLTILGIASITAGTFTGSASYILTCDDDFLYDGGTLATNTVRLKMAGDGATINMTWASNRTQDPYLNGLEIAANVSITPGVLVMTYTSGATYVTVDSGKALTIGWNGWLSYNPSATSTFTNAGTITGAGTLRVLAYSSNATVTFGTVTSLVWVGLSSGTSADRTITLGANTTLGSGLTVDSGHPTYVCTLDPAGFSLIVQGDVMVGNNALIAGANTLTMNGAGKTLDLNSSLLYNLNISSKISAKRLNVTNDISVSSSGRLTVYSDVSEDFVKYRGNPILDPIAPYMFKDPCLFYENEIYYMFYTCGYNRYNPWTCGIGMATSSDFHTWTNAGPIMNATESYDGSSIAAPFIYKNGATYYMFYQGQGTIFEINVATTTNITNTSSWQKYAGNPIVAVGPPGSYDASMVYDPSVIQVGGVFRLYYMGNPTHSDPGRLCFATSTDLLHWTKYTQNPIFTATRIEADNIIYHDGFYFIFCTMFSAVDTHQYTGLLISQNGIDWSENENPMIIPQESYELGRTNYTGDNGTSSPGVCIVNDTLKIAYQSANSDYWGISVLEGNISLGVFWLFAQTGLISPDLSLSFRTDTNLNYLEIGPDYLNLISSESFILDRSDGAIWGSSFSGGSLSVNISQWSTLQVTWTSSKTDSQSVMFTISGLEDGRMYRLRVDGIPSFLLTANGTGALSFTYSGSWSEHQFEIVATSITRAVSPLVNLVFLMFAVGVAVGVIAEGTYSLRKKEILNPEQSIKMLVNMLLYIIIGIAGFGILYSIIT